MIDMTRDINRITSVVNSLQAQVTRGMITVVNNNGIPSVTVSEMPMALGQANPNPIYVIQGANVFAFGSDEMEAAEELAEEINSALADFSRAYRRKAASKISELLSAGSPKTAKKKS